MELNFVPGRTMKVLMYTRHVHTRKVVSFFHFSNKYFGVIVRLSKSLVEEVAINGKLFSNLTLYNFHVHVYKCITYNCICKLKIRITITFINELIHVLIPLSVLIN